MLYSQSWMNCEEKYEETCIVWKYKFYQIDQILLENDVKRKVEFVVVDREFITEDFLDDVPVVAFEEFVKCYDKINMKF